jgi:putative ATPase
VLGERMRRYDKGGEQFYDTISALHKSVRGSDPDATLYWFVRMLDGGVDPRYVARRMIRMAVEDIGLADPRALRIALDAADVYERLGTPEGELALAECLVYLAVAPKSNAVYDAYNEARAWCARTARGRCRCTCAMRPPTDEGPGYGKDYRYATTRRALRRRRELFPEGMRPPQFYRRGARLESIGRCAMPTMRKERLTRAQG